LLKVKDPVTAKGGIDAIAAKMFEYKNIFFAPIIEV
jgi:hypothetical protein